MRPTPRSRSPARCRRSWRVRRDQARREAHPRRPLPRPAGSWHRMLRTSASASVSSSSMTSRSSSCCSSSATVDELSGDVLGLLVGRELLVCEPDGPPRSGARRRSCARAVVVGRHFVGGPLDHRRLRDQRLLVGCLDLGLVDDLGLARARPLEADRARARVVGSDRVVADRARPTRQPRSPRGLRRRSESSRL